MATSIPKSVKCHNCAERNAVMKRCTRCQLVYYCSRDCQIKDWAAHKLSCGQSSTKHSKDASKDIWSSVEVDPLREEAPARAPAVVNGPPIRNVNVAEGEKCIPSTPRIDFQKAVDSLKSVRKVNKPSSESSSCATYLDGNHWKTDLPSVEKDEHTFVITLKVNKQKLKVTLQDGWTAREMMKVISYQTQIPLNKLKIIHKGKIITEDSLINVAKEKAVFQVIGETAESEVGLESGDVNILMRQLHVDRKEAVKALRDQGDVVDAMLFLGNK